MKSEAKIDVVATLLLGSFLLLGSTIMVHVDQRAYARYQPLEAEILSLGTEKRRSSRTDDHSIYYRPRARFSYHVDGQSYTSSQFTRSPPDYVARDWARALLEPYAKGETVTAYYDPANPRQAVLQRMANPSLYACVLIGGGLLGLATMRWSRRGKRKQVVEPSGSHFVVQPIHRLRLRLRDLAVGMAIWGLTALAAAAHYNAYPGTFPPYPTMIALWGVGLYLGIGGWGVFRLVQNLRVFQWADDAEVWLKRDHLVLGKRNSLLYTQTIRRPVNLQKLSVDAKLYCKTKVVETDGDGEEKKRRKESVVHEAPITRVEIREISPYRPLRIRGKLSLPADLSPTTPTGTREDPQFYWTIRATLEPERGTTYEAEFPVRVAMADERL